MAGGEALLSGVSKHTSCRAASLCANILKYAQPTGSVPVKLKGEVRAGLGVVDLREGEEDRTVVEKKVVKKLKSSHNLRYLRPCDFIGRSKPRSPSA